MCFVDFGFTEVLTLVGKNVIVRGQLFHMLTGHHHTRVLINVQEIQSNNK